MKHRTLLHLSVTLPALLLLAPVHVGAAETTCEAAIQTFDAEATATNGIMTASVADALATAATVCQHEAPTGVSSTNVVGWPFGDNEAYKPAIKVNPPSGCAAGIASTFNEGYVRLRVITNQVWTFESSTAEAQYTYKTNTVAWQHKLVANAQGLYGLLAHDKGFGGAITIGPASVPADSADALGNCTGQTAPCQGQGIALWDHGFAMFADGSLDICPK
jgi:hypothetical protein